MLDLLFNYLPAALGALVGAAALFFGHGRLQRRRGRQEERAEAEREISERFRRGLDRGHAEREAGRGLTDRQKRERIRAHDAEWEDL